jgi:hypothetical protein
MASSETLKGCESKMLRTITSELVWNALTSEDGVDSETYDSIRQLVTFVFGEDVAQQMNKRVDATVGSFYFDPEEWLDVDWWENLTGA